MLLRFDVNSPLSWWFDFKNKIKNCEFREDFFYRIANIILEVPSLRERKEDIPEFCKNYLDCKNCIKSLSDSTLNMLCDFDWPGNIRQLQSTLDRAIFNADNNHVIEPDHIEIY